jgi:hypothetical protein
MPVCVYTQAIFLSAQTPVSVLSFIFHCVQANAISYGAPVLWIQLKLSSSSYSANKDRRLRLYSLPDSWFREHGVL